MSNILPCGVAHFKHFGSLSLTMQELAGKQSPRPQPNAFHGVTGPLFHWLIFFQVLVDSYHKSSIIRKGDLFVVTAFDAVLLVAITFTDHDGHEHNDVGEFAFLHSRDLLIK